MKFRKLLVMSVLVITLCCGVVLSACGGGNGDKNGNPVTFSLTYTAGAGGTIFGDTVQIVESGKDGTDVFAVANTGYTFTDWSDGRTDLVRKDTNVISNITVTANFIPATEPSLAIPQNIAIDNHVVSWDAVANAGSYRVRVGAFESSPIFSGTTYSLNGRNIPVGTHNVSVKAIVPSITSQYIDSEYSETDLTYTVTGVPLVAPVIRIAVSHILGNGVNIVWPYTNTPGVDVGTAILGIKQIYPTVGELQVIDADKLDGIHYASGFGSLNNHLALFRLEDYLQPNRKYEISVKILANAVGYQSITDGKRFVDSEWSEPIEVTMGAVQEIDAPTFTVSSIGVLNWNFVSKSDFNIRYVYEIWDADSDELLYSSTMSGAPSLLIDDLLKVGENYVTVNTIGFNWDGASNTISVAISDNTERIYITKASDGTIIVH